MAITRSTAIRNAEATALANAVNAGTTATEGAVVLMTSGDVEVATLRMSNPAFGTVSNGAITANAITNDSSATGGVVALFKVEDRDGTEIYRGTVGLDGSGADMEMDPSETTLTITANSVVSLASLVYTAGA